MRFVIGLVRSFRVTARSSTSEQVRRVSVGPVYRTWTLWVAVRKLARFRVRESELAVGSGVL